MNKKCEYYFYKENKQEEYTRYDEKNMRIMKLII